MLKECFCGNCNLEEYSEHYYRCPSCNTLISKCNFSQMIYKVENESEDLYGKLYWQKEMLRISGLNDTDELIDFYLKERCAYWCKYIIKYVKPNSKIAETGCGLGQLLYLLQVLGYKVKGFELSEEICEYIENTLKVSMNQGELCNSHEKFDAILGFDLFEHIVDPRKFLIDCREKLGKNGILCFQTPCYDDLLSYNQMLEKKPRFKEQLKKEQHIFLYSKGSIKKILEESGFPYVTFEPAYFGNDYDMFLFASASPIEGCNDDKWNKRLISMPNGRMIKALISLEEQVRELGVKFNECQKDGTKRLESINILTTRLNACEEDRKARLCNINILTERLEKCHKELINMQTEMESLNLKLVMYQKDSAERLQNMDILTDMLKKEQKEKTYLLEKIEKLSKQLDVSQDKSLMYEDKLKHLYKQIEECQKDSKTRLDNTNILAKQLENCQRDSEARLNNMNTLEKLLIDQQNQCMEKEEVIQKQLALIKTLQK